MDIETGLLKLNNLLPLSKRQQSLLPLQRLVHQEILYSLLNRGMVDEIIDPAILNILENNDLVVLDSSKLTVLGAYPFSLRKTVHRIIHENIDIFAMCAFDAVAIAPVFGVNITILSSCHVTNANIRIQQHGDKLISAEPGKDIFIGIRWQDTASCAADNLCTEMVFLKNETIAKQWKDEQASLSIFSLADAINFSTTYFQPLIGK